MRRLNLACRMYRLACGREITLALLIAQIEAIPEGSFEQGGLNGVFAVLERSRKSELDETSRGELAARGRRGQARFSTGR